MKSSIFTSFILCLSISIASGTHLTNPWDLSKISIGDIHELEDVLFDMDQTDFKHGSEALASLLEFLLENKDVKVELRGHTNSIPPNEYCNELSEKRAQKVKVYLIDQGVNPDNLVAKGYGKRVPKSSNQNSSGRTSNQRVDVRVLSL